MNVSIARISPTEDDRLNVQRFSSWVGNGHVHNPLYLVAVLQLTVWPQHLHHHVQGPGPRERHVLQQRQVILLSELVTDGFSFSEKATVSLIHIIGHVSCLYLRNPPSGNRTKYCLCFFRKTFTRWSFSSTRVSSRPAFPDLKMSFS